MGREVHHILTEFSRAANYGVELVHQDVHRPVLPSSKYA
jgi:hypothetical protein